MADRILDSIESPNMLALLTDEELAILAGEIRDEILNTTSQTGGHVASSLGAVEIILAVHSLINSPERSRARASPQAIESESDACPEG